MATLRSVAFFIVLYAGTLATLHPALDVPGLSALFFLASGILASFPVDRIHAFFLWASESLRPIREYRTCAIATPSLKREPAHWHLLGTIKERR